MSYSTLIACSGPGAGQAIGNSIRIAFVLAGISAVFLLATAAIYIIGRRNALVAGSHLMLMVFHPAWTVSAIMGDCGTTKVAASVLFLMVSTGLLVTAIIRTKWPSLPWQNQHRQSASVREPNDNPYQPPTAD